MDDFYLNYGIVIKAAPDIFEKEVKPALDSIPGVRVVFVTSSAGKLFVVPESRGDHE